MDWQRVPRVWSSSSKIPVAETVIGTSDEYTSVGSVGPTINGVSDLKLRSSELHLTAESVVCGPGFVQKSDCGFLDFSRTKLLLFQTFQSILFIFM